MYDTQARSYYNNNVVWTECRTNKEFENSWYTEGAAVVIITAVQVEACVRLKLKILLTPTCDNKVNCPIVIFLFISNINIKNLSTSYSYSMSMLAIVKII